jgi:hypothetical protein
MNAPNPYFSIQRLPLVCYLIPLMFGAACTSPVYDDLTINQSIIESVTVKTEQPWRLDSAWQLGGLGGAVWHPSAIEHVVRQSEPKWRSVTDADYPVTQGRPDKTSNGSDANIEPSRLAMGSDNEHSKIERAWRKYCRHQLDMSSSERALIDSTEIPEQMRHRCDPRSLFK